jgi:hypothetical protein
MIVIFSSAVMDGRSSMGFQDYKKRTANPDQYLEKISLRMKVK